MKGYTHRVNEMRMLEKRRYEKREDEKRTRHEMRMLEKIIQQNRTAHHYGDTLKRLLVRVLAPKVSNHILALVLKSEC